MLYQVFNKNLGSKSKIQSSLFFGRQDLTQSVKKSEIYSWSLALDHKAVYISLSLSNARKHLEDADFGNLIILFWTMNTM